MLKKIKDYKILILKDNDFNIRELNIYKIFTLTISLLIFFSEGKAVLILITPLRADEP